MALIPFKTTDKSGKASGRSIIILGLVLFAIIGWMCAFK
tara:strand:- start:6120 stop:6236 length:117 start_codon:yes stop_codon:yes gene_type:complete